MRKCADDFYETNEGTTMNHSLRRTLVRFVQ
jgi:hypothetical protein